MNHRVDANVEWHAFFTFGKGTFRGVARYCGTGKIREWGPLSSCNIADIDLDTATRQGEAYTRGLKHGITSVSVPIP